jgi:Transmembrane domain of unknown function (DUF3566)
MPAETSGVTTGGQDQGAVAAHRPPAPDGDGNGHSQHPPDPAQRSSFPPPATSAVAAPPARPAPSAPAGGGEATTDAIPAPPVIAPPPGPGPGPTAEPPPPPVLVPPGGSRIRRRGRHSGRADRASRRGLRVNQRLWSIDPWSVFKISALFYLSLGLIILVAGTLLYNAGRSVGTVDQVESFVTRMGAYGTCTAKADLPAGTAFEEDDDCAEGQVLVGGFKIDDGTLFKAAAIGTAILVTAGSIGNVLLTVLINLLNELTGGLRHTIVKEPVRRPRSSSPRRQPQG